MLVSSVMMQKSLPFLLLLIALPVAAAQTDAQKVVAVVNGETITAQKLDQLYARMGAQMRQQYERVGGKAAFLDNYIKKRLLIQEAAKVGFDKRPDVQADIDAARESTIFDRYVRDVVSMGLVNDAASQQYYQQHQDEFATPERVHVRHIVITATETGPTAKTKAQALEKIKALATQLHESNFASRTIKDPNAAEQLRINQFKQMARQYSEDASGQSGGDLGWMTKGQLDPDFEAAAFALKPGIPSGIVETKFGYHLILVEAREAAGVQSFNEARASIREYLMNQHAAEVMQTVAKLTNELRASSKVAVYLENIR
jgi:EpsD family peptidyl-prolyl cis-trans isomerase